MQHTGTHLSYSFASPWLCVLTADRLLSALACAWLALASRACGSGQRQGSERASEAVHTAEGSVAMQI